MPEASQEEVFLATTAIEEFWDTSRPIVFLGTWCQRYARRTFWQSLNAKTLESPYSEEQALEIFDRLAQLYDRALGTLSQRLNLLHGANHSRRYWEILAGPWLLYLLHTTYDRYVCLLSALERFPKLTTLALAEECYSVPADTLDFVTKLQGERYNLQLYSSVLRLMGRDYPRKSLPSTPNPAVQEPGYARRLAEHFLARFQTPGKILHFQSYFPHATQFRLALKTAGRFWPAAALPRLPHPAPVNREMRQKLLDASWGESEFECMLPALAADNAPQSLVENYSLMSRLVEKHCQRSPKAIFSAVSWHYDDVFKLWAAQASESGTLLLGEQHGGTYGNVACVLQEKHELSILDRFYSWGWHRQGRRARVIPLPPAKMMGRKPPARRICHGHSLYVMNVWSRYLAQFPITTRCWDAYFDDHAAFMGALSAEAKTRLHLRPHRVDLGWDVRQRLQDMHPSVAIEDWDTPLKKSLETCSLFICDHPFYATTFIEALAAGRPSILFYDPRFAGNRVHPDAEDLYGGLRSVGILLGSPLQAAAQVNAICHDPWTWWDEPRRSQAVTKFLEKYARMPPDALAEWTREFDAVLRPRA